MGLQYTLTRPLVRSLLIIDVNTSIINRNGIDIFINIKLIVIIPTIIGYYCYSYFFHYYSSKPLGTGLVVEVGDDDDGGILDSKLAQQRCHSDVTIIIFLLLILIISL